MSWFDDKEKRGYIGSWVYIILVFTIIAFLSFQEVPSTNKDLITTIIGMLVASLGIVVYTLIGKDENEVQVLKAEKEILIQKNSELSERVDHLEEMFMKLQTQVIDKLSIVTQQEDFDS